MMHSVRIEMPNKELKGYMLGDKVVVTIKGKVKALEAGRDPNEKEKKGKEGMIGEYKPTANLEVEVSSQDIELAESVYGKLAKDEENDE